MSVSSFAMDASLEQEFKMLQAEGKRLAAEGRLQESLQKMLLAKEICPTPKVVQRIEKLKEHIKKCGLDKSESASSEVSCAEEEREKNHSISSVRSISTGITKVLSDVQNLQSFKNSNSDEQSPQSQLKWKEMRNRAKELSYEGRYEEAIKCFKTALNIYDCPKMRRYLQELERVTRKEGQESEVVEKTEDAVAECAVPKNETSNKSESCVLSDEEEKLSEVKELYYEAREMAAEGKLKEALKLLKKAETIRGTEKVQKQIKKIEELLLSKMDDAVGDEMVKICSDFSVFHEIYNQLYPYQREGVAWMWKLNKMKKGGVLGDDMGLGKTFQVIGFVSGMIDADLVKNVLIVMPVSLLQNWEKEFKKWCPGIAVQNYHGGSKKERERSLLRVQRRGHVLLTSYGMVVGNLDQLTKLDGKEFIWDYLILDEGHKIKNPTKTTKAVHDISSKNRLVLTGTPIQNNLRELWSLYDFVHQGALLGSLKTFKLQYENPITRAREKDATAGEKRLGNEMAENLKSLIKPYFLRRTKAEIWGTKGDSSDVTQIESGLEKLTISQLNAKKNDIILWTFLNPPQIEIYQSFLHSAAVKSILVSKRSPLVELTTLKKICDHPRLLSKRACLQLGLDGELRHEDLVKELDDESSAASSIENVSDETLLHESGKLKLVIELVHNLRDTGHRTLIFSLSRKILDMIHRILTNRQWKVMRLDGTITKMEERERRIQRFQNDPSYPVFLLTTQVGGVGITLTAADRVIIYDPSWNPATDAQAVDRAYRIGQQNNVVIYRLITCGTVEEKIYRRQIFKDSITRQTTGAAADPHRYFSKQELRELFVLDNPQYSATQVQLAEMHSSERNTEPSLEEHIEYLNTLDIFGISHHDLMFTREVQDHTEDNDEAAVSIDYIKKQVAMAHLLIQKEASVAEEGMRLAGVYNRPYQELVSFPKKSALKDTYKPPPLPDVIDLTDMPYKAVSPLSKSMQSEPADCIDLTDSPARRTAIPDSMSPKNEMYYSPEGKFSASDNFQLHPSVPMSAQSPKSYFAGIPSTNDTTYEKERIQSEESSGDSSSNPIQLPPKSIEPPALVSAYDSEEDEQDLSPAKGSTLVMDCKLQDESSKVLDSGGLAPLERETSSESLRVDLDLQENFQSNLTRLMTDDLEDDSFYDEVSNNRQKNRRKSCAQKSAIFISDSETSQQDSYPPSLNSTAQLVEYSDDSDSGDSSNNASLSFIPDSMPNTPQANKNTKSPQKEQHEPSGMDHRSLCLETELKSTPQNISVLKRQNGSAGRITPLKVDRSMTYQDASFSKALAASPILHLPNFLTEAVIVPAEPLSTSFEPQSHPSSNTSLTSSNDDDSPVKMHRKRANLLSSDSEESADETEVQNSVLVQEGEHAKSSSLEHSQTLFSEEESSAESEVDSMSNQSRDSDDESESSENSLD